MDFESLEVFFNHLNLSPIKDVLMGAYHRFSLGRPPFNPLALVRFKIIHILNGYRSRRTLEKKVNVDSRVRKLCGFDESIPSYSTIVRFERRIGFERLKKLVRRTIEDLVNCGFTKGLKVVPDSTPLKARCRRDLWRKHSTHALSIQEEKLHNNTQSMKKRKARIRDSHHQKPNTKDEKCSH